MGQRASIASPRRTRKKLKLQSLEQPCYWSTFETELGWFGMLGQDGLLCRLTIGHSSKKKLRVDFSKVTADAIEEDWDPALRKSLQQYAAGEKISFDSYGLQLPAQTKFQKHVVKQTQQIQYGETISYGELAKRAGSPNAARAVGTVMSSNLIPILIPCHRVVGANGHLGGFSAPQGTTLKQKMLLLEAE